MDYEIFSYNNIRHILYISYHVIICSVATHGHSPSNYICVSTFVLLTSSAEKLSWFSSSF
jgi:hypothetical protein